MTNRLLLALNEFMKKDAPSAQALQEKYALTPTELWTGYAQMKATRG